MIGVLIVDDDFMVTRIHTGFVDAVAGFTTLATAGDGASAVREAAQLQPDLVLLDIYLPDRSGVELIPELRRVAPEADIMIITAAREAATVRTSVRQGVVGYLLKPFTQETLTTRLTAYQAHRNRLAQVAVHDQLDIDEALRATTDTPTRPPKGISQETAELVVAALNQSGGTLSATETGVAIGISRVSARRYLEWLTRIGRAEVRLRYGSQGRPERRYRSLGPSSR